MHIILFIFLFFTVLVLPPPSYAIIFIPALILIPIAKILAIFIAGFSIPAIGIGALWSRMVKRPVYYGVVYGVIALLFLSLVVGVILKIVYPEQPLF